MAFDKLPNVIKALTPLWGDTIVSGEVTDRVDVLNRAAQGRLETKQLGNPSGNLPNVCCSSLRLVQNP